MTCISCIQDRLLQRTGIVAAVARILHTAVAGPGRILHKSTAVRTRHMHRSPQHHVAVAKQSAAAKYPLAAMHSAAVGSLAGIPKPLLLSTCCNNTRPRPPRPNVLPKWMIVANFPAPLPRPAIVPQRLKMIAQILQVAPTLPLPSIGCSSKLPQPPAKQEQKIKRQSC